MSKLDQTHPAQNLNFLPNLGALNDVSEERLGAYAMGCADQIMRGWQRNPERTRNRLSQARVKYGRVTE